MDLRCVKDPLPASRIPRCSSSIVVDHPACRRPQQRSDHAVVVAAVSADRFDDVGDELLLIFSAARSPALSAAPPRRIPANVGLAAPADMPSSLSEPFERGQSKADGVWFGLAIAKAIAACSGSRRVLRWKGGRMDLRPRPRRKRIGRLRWLCRHPLSGDGIHGSP